MGPAGRLEDFSDFSKNRSLAVSRRFAVRLGDNLPTILKNDVPGRCRFDQVDMITELLLHGLDGPNSLKGFVGFGFEPRNRSKMFVVFQ